jgi:hypothetical protein
MATKTAAKAPVAKKPGTAVAKAGGTAVALPNGVNMAMLLEDSNNSPQFGKDDLAIPFLRVLQKGSPEVNKRDDKYVEGAEAGMFFNTLTKELWDGENEGIIVIPAAYTPSYIEWWPRDSKAGKGIFKDHGPDGSILEQTTRDEKTGRSVTERGTEVVKSGQYFVLVVDPETGDAQQLVFALAGTQLRKSRTWNSLIKGLLVTRPDGNGKFNPAPFYLSYKVTTLFESNDKGDWMGVNIAPDKATIEFPQGGELYQQARQFAAMVGTGKAKAAPITDVEFETVEGGAEQEFGA